MKVKVLWIAGLMLAATAGQAQAGVINFDTGTAGNAVGAFYAGLGVTFSNTEFVSNFGLAGSSGTLGIRSISHQFQPVASNPLVATFSSAQSFVSILGIDVGDRGMRIDAYDAAVGGSLVAFDAFTGTGLGVGAFATISTASASILRVEFYQPNNISSSDGILWEDFTFSSSSTAVPEPTSIAMFGLGALGLIVARRKREQKKLTA